MIKNLKSKIIICLFLLVTVFSVTSSCFASATIVESPYSVQDFLDSGQFNSEIYSYDSSKFKYVGFYSAPYMSGSIQVKESYHLTIIYDANDSLSYIKQYKYGSNDYRKFNMYDKNDNLISLPYSQVYVNTTAYYRVSSTIQNGSSISGSGDTSNNPIFTDLTTVKAIAIDGSVMYEPNLTGVDVTHEFQSDTSARVNFVINNAPDGAYLQYSLTGVEINTDLNAPLQLRNPITYTPGVTNLIVKPNTKVYWMLYDSNGDVLDTNVYQVPEYDSVIENSNKSIEYSVTYNEDNSLATLTVNVVNGEFSDKLYYTENGMVSNDYAGKQLFPASKTLQIDHNCNMHIILYDPFDNLITAKYVTINKIGSIPEQNFKVDVTKGDKTVYVRPRLYNVLQSRFYSIEYDVVLDTFTASKDIELHQDGVYVGKVIDTSQTYTCGSDSELKFYQSIGTSNITVTFRIINAETGETCITRTVSFKIGLDDESTGVTDSTTNGVTDNSFITSGAGSSYSDVANMGISDYYNMVNTNNTAWSFFKVILNSLPNWITLPLSLLIFGVVTITLYRFIRGA